MEGKRLTFPNKNPNKIGIAYKNIMIAASQKTQSIILIIQKHNSILPCCQFFSSPVQLLVDLLDSFLLFGRKEH